MNKFALKFYLQKSFKFFKEHFLFMVLFLAFFYYLGKEAYFYFSPSWTLRTSSDFQPISATQAQVHIVETEVQQSTEPFNQTFEEGRNLNRESELQKEAACVFISGAINKSQRYPLEKGDTFEQLLEKSGGLLEEELKPFLNLKRPLQANEVFYIPSLEELYEQVDVLEKAKKPWWWKNNLYLFSEESEKEDVPRVLESHPCALPKKSVYLEHFSESIEDLPLNQKMKKQIKAYLAKHDLKHPEDLLKIKGIGEKTFLKILPYILFEKN